MLNILALIPARGGSKGIPGKNIKELKGKPLINYTIDAAREIFDDKDICVSTDNQDIIDVVENYGLLVPFMRPDEFATDFSTSVEVILHAIDYYENKGEFYETVVLLQPTSPLRKGRHIREALDVYNDTVDMVVSVKKSSAASTICEENMEGYLELILNKRGGRRQEVNYYEYNGAIYVINVSSLKKYKTLCFPRVRKYVMDEYSSVDIDTLLDFWIVESILKNVK